MYQVGEVIVYGNKGVFRIENIGVPDIEWLKAERDYYTLLPLYREEKIFTPVDTDVYMRPVMTKDEAMDLIAQIPNITADPFDCKNPHTMESYYQASLDSHDCVELIKIIKKIYEKLSAAQKAGRKLAQIDEKYMKKAENILYEELAAALDIQKENVVAYISDCLDALENKNVETVNG